MIASSNIDILIKLDQLIVILCVSFCSLLVNIKTMNIKNKNKMGKLLSERQVFFESFFFYTTFVVFHFTFINKNEGIAIVSRFLLKVCKERYFKNFALIWFPSIKHSKKSPSILLLKLYNHARFKSCGILQNGLTKLLVPIMCEKKS